MIACENSGVFKNKMKRSLLNYVLGPMLFYIGIYRELAFGELIIILAKWTWFCCMGLTMAIPETLGIYKYNTESPYLHGICSKVTPVEA